MADSRTSFWARYWHTPVRAERLGFMRVLVGLALLADQLLQYLPHFAEFYGPEGICPAGLQDGWRLNRWDWTVLFFNTDNLAVLYPVFGLWVAVTIAFLLGWRTRWTSILVWFLTMCFHNRNRAILNFGDQVLEVGLFLLMLSPSGLALSLDRRRQEKRRRAEGLPPSAPLAPAWPVRMLQIQLCMIYLTTGLAKLCLGETWFEGTWWDGTSLHYVLNNLTLTRWSYAQLPLPLWLTMPLTYLSVWWEVLFPLLVLSRWTRRWALWFGVVFHIGIYLTIEVGWFTFYILCFYAVWLPDRFWERFARTSALSQPTSASQVNYSAIAPVNKLTTNR
jgi:uncharacterized membrane protein YphA (DoxX/SURF4 family)